MQMSRESELPWAAACQVPRSSSLSELEENFFPGASAFSSLSLLYYSLSYAELIPAVSAVRRVV